MNTTNKLYLIALTLVSCAFSSCTSEDPVPENDEELITDVTLTFVELDGSRSPIGIPFTVKASDPQGIELGNPDIETIVLEKGKVYSMGISLFNSVSNEDITEEISAEADEHQFYFLGSALVGNPFLIYKYYDNILGLDGRLQVAFEPVSNNGNMRIILRHALDKNYPGAAYPDFEEYAQAGGESDLDITFPVVISN